MVAQYRARAVSRALIGQRLVVHALGRGTLRSDVADGHHIAQVNIALPRQPLDTPLLAEFVAALAPVNALADTSPGFVWRLQTEDGDATAIRAFDDDRLVVNMSLWESLEALRAFVYGERGHLAVMRRRREWFVSMAESHMALWWVAAGELPTVADAEQRVAHLREHGPTPYAFTFRVAFPSPEGAAVVDERWLCPSG